MEELLPYHFEPEYSGREELDDDHDVDVDDDDDDSHSSSFPDLTHELETDIADRVGNMDWCSCGSCIARERMPLLPRVRRSSELGDKMDFNSRTLALLLFGW